MFKKKRKVVSKGKRFGLLKEYKNCFEYLRGSKNYIYFSILLFFIFAIVGFFFQDLINLFFNSFFGVDLNEKIINALRAILEKTQGMSQAQLTGFIFFNNLQSSFYSIILGVLFGIFPLFSAIFNGYILGFVAIFSAKVEGISVLWRIFPHGIFELPAIFISIGLGLKLGVHLFIRKNKKSFKYNLINSLKIFLLVIFPLLVLAAIIEATLISIS